VSRNHLLVLVRATGRSSIWAAKWLWPASQRPSPRRHPCAGALSPPAPAVRASRHRSRAARRRSTG